MRKIARTECRYLKNLFSCPCLAIILEKFLFDAEQLTFKHGLKKSGLLRLGITTLSRL